MRFRNANPVYRRIMDSTDYREQSADYVAATYAGVARKAMYFIALVFIGAFVGLWLMNSHPNIFLPTIIIAAFSTFFLAFLGLILPSKTKFFGSLYCLAEGMLVGVLSLAFEVTAPGIVMVALLSTVVVLAIVATLFLTNVVKVNGRFMRFLMIFSISLISSIILIFILDLIFKSNIFNLTIIAIASLSTFLATLYLFFDLERVYQIVEGGAPETLEWNVAFGLVYTLVWLYIEILRLAFIILSSDK